MRHMAALVPGIVIGLMATAPRLPAQQATDTLNLGRIYAAGDSSNGAPVVDTLPQLMQCPMFDPKTIRGDAATFSFERRPVVEEHMPPVRVTLEFVVDQGGRVEQRTARVLRSSDDRLNRSFEYWVTDCRFRPGKIRGHAVRVKMQRDWEVQPGR